MQSIGCVSGGLTLTYFAMVVRPFLDVWLNTLGLERVSKCISTPDTEGCNKGTSIIDIMLCVSVLCQRSPSLDVTKCDVLYYHQGQYISVVQLLFGFYFPTDFRGFLYDTNCFQCPLNLTPASLKDSPVIFISTLSIYLSTIVYW